MSFIATRKLIFMFADEQNKIYYYKNGVVSKATVPPKIMTNPNGWKDMTLKFDTNQSYFATLRSLTDALKFIDDGEAILNDRILNGRGTEEILFLIILRNNPAKGLNFYDLEYKERVDLSTWNADPRTGVSVNMLQYDVFSLVQANENTMYSVPCNSSNPLAVPVLFDGTLLQDKINYSVINETIHVTTLTKPYFALPITQINEEGDSVNVVTSDQTFDNFGDPAAYVENPINANNFLSGTDTITYTITGSFSFTYKPNPPFNTRVKLFLMKNTDVDAFPASQMLFDETYFTFNQGVTTIDFTATITLAPSVKLFLILYFDAFSITPLATNIAVIFASEQDPTVNYVMRPLDVLQSLVQQITLGKYTAASNFLSLNNRKCPLSGSSLRSFPDANIQTCFADFFQSYSATYNMGLAVRNGVLWMEPVEDLYNSNNEILRLPNISKPILTVAKEYYYAGAKVGYLKQTYNKRNGRYEFNCTHNYSFPITSTLNTLNLVSPYRADSFGMEFIRTGYPDLTTTDDKGDNDVFTVMVSDAIGQAEGVIDNTVPINILTLITAAPVIKSPFSNTLVYSPYPTFSGVSQPNKLITVYADGFADGTVRADGNGNWTYQLVNPLRVVSLIFNGSHSITANAQNNPNDISTFSIAVIVTVNPALTASFVITSPTPSDSIYDNLPMITGTAPQGSAVRVKLDGAIIGSVVANSSSIWSFQTTTPIANGDHTITASIAGLPDAPAVGIAVNSAVDVPLITKLLFNQTLYTNLPLITGVAIPGTIVDIYVDGGGGAIISGIAGPVGTAVANASGNWQYQFVSMVDPATDLTIDYVPDGQHDFGTTPLPTNVMAAVSGHRLMRGTNKGPVMDFDAIKLDDAYIPPGIDPSTLPPTLGQFLHPETLYNIIETEPDFMLRSHDNILSPFLSQQTGSSIIFNGAEVNANLTFKKNGVVTAENASVPVANLGAPLFWPFWGSFTSPIENSFNNTMTQLTTGGYITAVIDGLELYFLPIGTMTMKPATDEAQSWKLLLSGKTPFSTLLALLKNGITINIGPNMLYICDRNPLHFVKYGFTPAAGYHFADIYDDWQKHRFPRWKLYQPDFAQPFMTADTINLQAITNGVGTLQVQMISLVTGHAVDVLEFSTVIDSPVTTPNQLQEVSIPLAAYPPGQYWFALSANGAFVAISEKIDLRVDWPNTLKVEYGGSDDKIDYYFSSGIKPMIRVPGELLVWSADSEVDNYEDESGDWQITRGLPTKSRVIQFGNEDSLLSDWMSLKMNMITLLENVLIEGTHYTRDNDSKWEPDDLGQGIPELLVKIALLWAQNATGNTFATPGDQNINSVTYSIDGTAVGMDTGSVINVTDDQTT